MKQINKPMRGNMGPLPGPDDERGKEKNLIIISDSNY